MKLFKYLLTIAAVGASTFALADGNQHAAIQKFIESKKDVPLKDKAEECCLAGDVRFSYASRQLKSAYGKQYGWDVANFNDNLFLGRAPSNSGGATAVDLRFFDNVGQMLPVSKFDVEFNLYTSMKKDKAFAKAWLQFANEAGVANFNVGSGEDNNVSLRQALVGYNLMEDGMQSLVFMLGRTPGNMMFDSMFQGAANRDGLFLCYTQSMENSFDLSVKLGAFVVDNVTSKSAYQAQVGFSNVADTGLNLSYSFTDWKNGWSRDKGQYVRGRWDGVSIGDNISKGNAGNSLTTYSHRYQYKISEVDVSYTLNPEVLSRSLDLYGSYGKNHCNDKLARTNNNKKDKFWCLGVNLGELNKAEDWCLDVRFSDVEANALAGYDMSMNGRGNYDNIVASQAAGDLNNPYFFSNAGTAAAAATGNTNFEGWNGSFSYAVTNNLSLCLHYCNFHEQDVSIGGKNDYRAYGAQVVYSF